MAGTSTAPHEKREPRLRLPQVLLCGEGQLGRFAAAARFVRVLLIGFVAGAFLRVGVGFATAGVCRCVFVPVVLAVLVTV